MTRIRRSSRSLFGQYRIVRMLGLIFASSLLTLDKEVKQQENEKGADSNPEIELTKGVGYIWK
jgi:hypothetical protein